MAADGGEQDWQKLYNEAKAKFPALQAVQPGTVAERVALVCSRASPAMEIVKEAVGAASDISGALTAAPLAGPIFAVLNVFFNQTVEYV